MKKLFAFVLAIGASLTLLSQSPVSAAGQTLQAVQDRGVLNCIINTGLTGFAYTDDNNRWIGFDTAFCRAVAAAVLGSGEKVKFVNATGKTRFTLLNSGEGDVLFRNTTATLSRDADVGLTFLPTSYYDGQGFIIRESAGVKSALELDGASICIQTGTTTELNLADYFRKNKISYESVTIETNEEARLFYLSGRCDAYTTDASGLAATRASFDDPQNHVILPEIISKEPLGGAVAQGDEKWAEIAFWTVYALIEAEELGITQANVKKMAQGTDNPSINRLLGTEGEMGKFLGLEKDWAVNAIAAEGNYGEIFERYLGVNTPLGLERGLNALWSDGGLLYAWPIR